MKDEHYLTMLSKFLSLVLRHKPSTIGIELDAQGWTDVETLIVKMNQFGKKIDFESLKLLVANDNKKRYAFNDDLSRIRASQGHSIDVELGYSPKHPPSKLYHGTADKFVVSILKSGLQKQKRHHVHLSKDFETAVKVGQRHGKPVVLEVDAEKMASNGYLFFESDNGVWLCEEVPAAFLKIVERLKD
jgi:putative RNA 2'-phosphotransferase